MKIDATRLWVAVSFDKRKLEGGLDNLSLDN